jgi:hypothetical protein
LTDRVALILALVLLAGIGADFALTGGATLVLLVRKFLDLMDTLVFWD